MFLKERPIIAGKRFLEVLQPSFHGFTPGTLCELPQSGEPWVIAAARFEVSDLGSLFTSINRLEDRYLLMVDDCKSKSFLALGQNAVLKFNMTINNLNYL